MKLRHAIHFLQTRLSQFKLTNSANSLVEVSAQLKQHAITQHLIFPPPLELSDLDKRFRQAIDSQNWQMLSLRDWRRVPFVLWYQSPYLVEFPTFLQQFWQKLEHHPKLIKRVLKVYLQTFTPQHRREIAVFLQTQFNSTNRFTPYLSDWTTVQHHYQLFSADETTITQFAHVCLQAGGLKILQQAQLTGDLAQSGYVHAVYNAALGLIKQNEWQNLTQLENFLTWSCEQQQLRYPHYRIALVESLLHPYLKKKPTVVIQKTIQIFLIQILKDPRTNKHAWTGIAAIYIDCFSRWLMNSTLETFFSLLDHCALDSHWQYRRDFWQYYHETHQIDEAWLAVGKNIQQFIYSHDELKTALNYAILTGRGIRKTHAVLLFRIQNLIIAEWSHEGKCHIWRTDNPYAPTLYLAQYSREQLTLYSLRIKPAHKASGLIHHNKEDKGWQWDIAHFIEQETGIPYLQCKEI